MPKRMHSLGLFAFLLSASMALTACDKTSKDERRGAPPPAVASGSACGEGGGTITDATTASFFPRTFSDYCIDPHGEIRTYGASASKDIDSICLEAFNGDCELYKSFGLERVVLLRYVDGSGSPGAVDAIVSKFSSAEGAYGMFTKRVVSDGDPARDLAPRPMELSGVGALGTGVAYLWKGQMVIELTYTNDQQPPKALEASSNALLPEIAKLVAEKLPGPGSLPKAAERLPEQHRIALGIAFEPKDAFEVQGGGAGATGYYQEGKKRYRILSITRADEHQAKDVLTSFAKRDGALRLKQLNDGVRWMKVDDGQASVEWLFARVDNQVFGIGDEHLVWKEGMGPGEREEVSLSKEEKIQRMRALLTPAK